MLMMIAVTIKNINLITMVCLCVCVGERLRVLHCPFRSSHIVDTCLGGLSAIIITVSACAVLHFLFNTIVSPKP